MGKKLWWILLSWFFFAASFLFTFLPLPESIYNYLGHSWSPLTLSITISLVFNSFAVILALLGIKRDYLSRFIMVSAVFYCGLALTLVIGQVMPRGIIDPEDHMSGISAGIKLMAFILIYFSTSLITFTTFEIGGHWIPALCIQDAPLGRSLFKTIGQVSTVSAVVAMIAITIIYGWEV